MTISESPISRRSMLAAAAIGGTLTATALANAETVDQLSEPRRPGRGGSNPGPKNPGRIQQNPDMIAPPATDHGTLPNLRFSFDDSHTRIEPGGWTRQVTVRELGISKNIAGVNMRLNAGGVRELHWHKAAEWAFVLTGTARITAVDADGRNFVDDVGIGDLWYFPSGIPHSIQGLDPDGTEFLLVFDDGDFDEDNTFLLSDWFKHTPPEVLEKNFGVPAATFADVPDPSRLYIFPAPVPGPLAADRIVGAIEVPQRFSHRHVGADSDPHKEWHSSDHRHQDLPGLQDHRCSPCRGRAWRAPRNALAPEHRRVAILHPGPGSDGRVRGFRSGPHLRFPCERCRLCAVRHGALHREHREHDVAVFGNIQKRSLC